MPGHSIQFSSLCLGVVALLLMPSLHSYSLNAPHLPFSTMIASHRTKKSPCHKESFTQHPDTEARKALKMDEIQEHVR